MLLNPDEPLCHCGCLVQTARQTKLWLFTKWQLHLAADISSMHFVFWWVFFFNALKLEELLNTVCLPSITVRPVCVWGFWLCSCYHSSCSLKRSSATKVKVPVCEGAHISSWRMDPLNDGEKDEPGEQAWNLKWTIFASGEWEISCEWTPAAQVIFEWDVTPSSDYHNVLDDLSSAVNE